MLPCLLLLFQAALPERPLEEAVEAFVKGEEKARAEILKAGACSILPLRKVRDRAPARTDALLYEIKKASAGFDVKTLVDALEARRSFDLGEVEFPAAYVELTENLPLLFDPALFRTHYERKVKIQMKDRPRREILEAMCRELGLDWGFFYDIVLMGPPERLWPSGPPPRTVPLTDAESRRAATWVEQLNDEQVDRREEALAALSKLGEGVIPLLEKAAQSRDAEGAGRARDLIARLRKPPPSGVFRSPAAERQKLAEADEAFRKSLRENMVSFKVADIVLVGALQLLLRPREIPFELAPSLNNIRVTVDLQNVSAWAVVSITCHAEGIDFVIENGKLIFDTKDALERRIPAGR